MGILEQELKNLRFMSGVKHIVQLVAMLVSANPYQTNETDDADVRSLLLEYHPAGTLEDALRLPDQGTS
jgi:hypothetical protein